MNENILLLLWFLHVVRALPYLCDLLLKNERAFPSLGFSKCRQILFLRQYHIILHVDLMQDDTIGYLFVIFSFFGGA